MWMTTKRDNPKRPELPPPDAVIEGPVRTCVACRSKDGRDDLVRWVAAEDGRVALDARAVRSGRGAWVHPTRKCVSLMVKRHAAERALKLAVVPDLEVGALLTQLRAALVQRITSLIVVSGRRRAIAIGTEAVSAALVRKRVPAVIVAGDAGEAARALAEASGRGGPRVLRYADKAALGALFNRGEVALVALLDPSVAAEAVSTIDRLAALEES
jgi:predicted RNA-binding protein YlxR (DUF448 family)